MNEIDFNQLYLKSVEHEAGHMYYLVKFIVEEFFRMKFNYEAHSKTISKQKNFIANKCKNMVKELGL